MLLLIRQILLMKDISTTEVKVVEGFKPAIPQATRLNEKATFSDTLQKDRSQEYTVIATDLKSDYKTRHLKAAKVKQDKIPQLYGTKVVVGFGNAFVTKASVVHNSMRSKTLSYGVLLNHFSNKYYIDEGIAKNSKNTMHLYAKKISSTHIFLGNLDYDRRTALYWSKDTPLLDEENYRNRFAYTRFSLSAISQELSADKLKHNTIFYISDFNEMSENRIHLGSVMSKNIRGYPFILDVEFDDYINYNNQQEIFNLSQKNVQLIDIGPSFSFERFGIDFTTALSINYFSDANKKIDIFPEVLATKELVKNILLISAGIDNPMYRNTYKSLSDENPFIHTLGTNQKVIANDIVLDLRTTEAKQFFFNIRNVLGKDEVFEGSVAYGSVENFAHFVGVDTLSYNRFLVEYIDVKQLHINANYDRKINNIMSVNVNADFYKWDTLVYDKPNFTCELSAPINLRNKIKVNPTLSYIGKRVYDVGKELSAQFHANLGLYYNYTQNIGAYLQLNNLTNSKQELWKDYREVGFNGLFGLHYSF